MELIYELSKRTMERADRKRSMGGQTKRITDAIYEIGNIEYCNLVVQNDEISG